VRGEERRREEEEEERGSEVPNGELVEWVWSS
jgi:hypothetical protein